MTVNIYKNKQKREVDEADTMMNLHVSKTQI